MADNEPITKIVAQESISNWRTKSNTTIDKRGWKNRTDLVDDDLDVAEDGTDQLVYVDASTATCDINLPASADVDGMQLIVYAKDATNTITIVRDGSDTINGASADPTLAVNTGKVLVSLGDGDWLMWSIP